MPFSKELKNFSILFLIEKGLSSQRQLAKTFHTAHMLKVKKKPKNQTRAELNIPFPHLLTTDCVLL